MRWSGGVGGGPYVLSVFGSEVTGLTTYMKDLTNDLQHSTPRYPRSNQRPSGPQQLRPPPPSQSAIERLYPAPKLAKRLVSYTHRPETISEDCLPMPRSSPLLVAKLPT
jgi:hypothetical protein